VITVTLTGLEFGYGESLFEPLDLIAGTGELTAVLGANGRGKSTLLHTITGMLPALGGAFLLSGQAGFVPQLFMPQFAYTVLDIVLMGRVSAVKLLSLPSEEDESIARDALSRVGMADFSGRPYNTLSGGQRQLVLIARALTIKSKTLILDEPTAALDLQNQLAVLRLLKQLAREEDMNIIFTTHEPTHALLVSDKTLLMMPDKRWLFGESRFILTEDHLMTAYGVPIREVSLHGGGYRAFIPVFEL
jgi:iron complex transport system ATP-binding protein